MFLVAVNKLLQQQQKLFLSVGLLGAAKHKAAI